MTVVPYLALAVLAAAHAFQLLSAGYCIHRLRPRRQASCPAAASGSVTVLAPIDAVGPFSEQCMSALLAIEPRPLEIIFCAFDESEPAAALARRKLRGEDHVCVMTGRATVSANPKLDNLEKGWAAARGDHVLIVDDNVVVPPDIIGRLTGKLDGRTGPVCAAIAGDMPGNFFAHVECAFLGPFQARMLFVSDLLTPAWAIGKVLLLDRRWYDERGGLQALRAYAAEDGGASLLAQRDGLKTRYADLVVRQPLGLRSLRQVWDRQLRWAMLRKAQVGPIFALEPLGTFVLPGVAALLSAPLLGLGPLAGCLLSCALWLLVDTVLSGTCRWPVSPLTPLASLAREMLGLPLWVTAWMRRSYVWRGHSIAIGE